MTPKEQADIAIELAKLAGERFEGRRSFEWKMAFAFWGILLVSMHPDYKTLRIPDWGLIASGLLFICVWLYGVWIANQNDKARFDGYFGVAETLLSKGIVGGTPDLRTKKKLACKSCRDFARDWNIQWQILVTCGLVLARVVYFKA